MSELLALGYSKSSIGQDLLFRIYILGGKNWNHGIVSREEFKTPSSKFSQATLLTILMGTHLHSLV